MSCIPFTWFILSLATGLYSRTITSSRTNVFVCAGEPTHMFWSGGICGSFSEALQSSVCYTFTPSVIVLHTDNRSIFQNSKYRNVCMHTQIYWNNVNHSKTIPNNFRLLPTSNNMLFLSLLSLSLAFCLVLSLSFLPCLSVWVHHPFKTKTGMFQTWMLMIQCWCWTRDIQISPPCWAVLAHMHRYHRSSSRAIFWNEQATCVTCKI